MWVRFGPFHVNPGRRFTWFDAERFRPRAVPGEIVAHGAGKRESVRIGAGAGNSLGQVGVRLSFGVARQAVGI